MIGDKAELGRTVRLLCSDETVVEDTVVLLYVDCAVLCPAKVTIFDDGGQELSKYPEFEIVM